MKDPKLLFSLLFCCLSFALFAQEPKMQLADYDSPHGRKMRASVSYEAYSGDDESEFYVVERDRGEYHIAVFETETLTKKSSFSMEEPEVGGHNPRWVKFFFQESSITLVYGIFDKRADRYTVYGQLIDLNGDVELEETELMEIKAARKKDIGNISSRLSDDGSKILLFREPPGRRFDKEKMEIALIDNNLNELYHRKLSFPYKYKSIIVEDIDVSDEGKVIIITEYTPQQRGKGRRRGPATEMVNKIFTIDEDNDELMEIELEQKGYAFSSLEGYIMNDQGKMMFTGFYRDAKTVRRRSDSYKGANGIYYIILDLASGEIEKRMYDKLDKTIMTQILGANTTEKRAKKSAAKGVGLRNYVIRNVMYDTAGGALITLEKSYVVQNCRTDQHGNTTCTYTYYDMELIEILLDNEGQILSTQIIPKKQVSRTSYYHSVITLEKDGAVFYVYNDTEKNLNPKKVKRGKNPGFQYYYSSSSRIFGNNKKRMVSVSVEEDGTLNKTPLTPSYKQNVTLYPKNRNARISNEVSIVWGYDVRKKSVTLVKLYLED
jgi:hypothetical protein